MFANEKRPASSRALTRAEAAGRGLSTTMPHNLFNSLQTFAPSTGKTSEFYSLPQLEQEGVGPISRLPVSIRIVLESVLRNFDGEKITEDDVRTLRICPLTVG